MMARLSFEFQLTAMWGDDENYDNTLGDDDSDSSNEYCADILGGDDYGSNDEKDIDTVGDDGYDTARIQVTRIRTR